MKLAEIKNMIEIWYDNPKKVVSKELRYSYHDYSDLAKAIHKAIDIGYKQMLSDAVETDDYIRKAARSVLSSEEVDGDIYEVPCIENIVDSLVSKVKATKVDYAVKNSNN